MSTQSLSHLLLPEGEFRVIRCDIADKLLECGDGDSALLYLYILRHGGAADEKSAMRALNLTKEKYDRALFTLTGLIITGQTLTVAQLRTLFTIYDFLGLPAEVIMELLGCLKRELGAVRILDIRREAYRWADMGLYTAEAAQDYLARREAERPLTEAMFAALGAEPREPKPMEKRLISYAVAHGFPPEAMELAVQRTHRALKKFSADYVRRILESWEQKGVHTISEITALEPETESGRQEPAITSPDASKLSEWEKEWLDEVARYKQTEEGH